MKIFGNIGRAIKNINAGKILTKATGIAALGLVAYDAHSIGKLQADLYSSEKDAKSAAYYLNNSMYSTNMSKVQEAVKDASYRMELDSTWKRFFNEGIGYVKGFTSMLVEHVVPLGLGLGTLLTKGKTAKFCAGGLGIYAIYEFMKNFFGWGTPGGPIK